MKSFVEKYKDAYAALRRYQDAPRRGWADPKQGKRADNQTIEIRRTEAMKMTEALASALYCNYSRLYENMALINYMDQIAADEPDEMVCGVCHNRYLRGWMNGVCPYCAAVAASSDKMQEMLKEGL